MDLKKAFLAMVCFLFLAQAVFAADAESDLGCQYKVGNLYTRDVVNFYNLDDNSLVSDENALSFEGVGIPVNSNSFTISNSAELPLTIVLSYDYVYRLPYAVEEQVSVGEEVEIPAEGELEISEELIGLQTAFKILPASLEFYFIDNNDVFVKTEEVNEYITECSICLGVQCLNDGAECSLNAECGGNYCIANKCTAAEVCYNNDCGCDSVTEVQCSDNTRCVTRDSLDLGATPICSVDECKSGFVDLSTGQCSKKDGDFCSIHSDCSGGYCINDRCNSLPVCFNNDCECDSITETQCFDNTRCVTKGSLEDGFKPACSPEECKSKNVNPDTGLCANPSTPIIPGPVDPVDPTPSDPQTPEPTIDYFSMYLSIGVIVVLIAAVLFAVYSFFKAKTDAMATEIKLSKARFKIKNKDRVLEEHGWKPKPKKRKPKAKKKKKKEKPKTPEEKARMSDDIANQAVGGKDFSE